MKLDEIWLCDLSIVHRNLYTQVQAWPHLSNSHILDVSEETGQWSFAAAACLKFVAACSSWPVPLKEMEQISKSFQAAGTAEAIIPATVGWLLMTGGDPMTGKGNDSLKVGLGISPDLNTRNWIGSFPWKQVQISSGSSDPLLETAVIQNCGIWCDCDAIDSDLLRAPRKAK